MNFPKRFITRTVDFKFSGVNLKFHLSQALFSQADIDAGSALLLKTLAQKADLTQIHSALDTGCGVGVLGLSLAKKHPQVQVTFQDRDALACAFTLENARLNGIENLTVKPALLLQEAPGPYDLIISNLPAKAGAPILADFFRRTGTLLSPQGFCAVVIVGPLAAWAEGQMAEAGLEILYKEETPVYTVFHFRGHSEALTNNLYNRSAVTVSRGPTSVSVPTAWGLTNFDRTDWETDLALDFLQGWDWSGRLLIWEPGQGILAAFIGTKQKKAPQFILAGRDVLALGNTAKVLESQGFKPEVYCVSCLEELENSVPENSLQGAIVKLTSDPLVPFAPSARAFLLRSLCDEAYALMTGSSTEMHRYLEERRGFVFGEKKKYHGFQAVFVQKKTKMVN